MIEAFLKVFNGGDLRLAFSNAWTVSRALRILNFLPYIYRKAFEAEIEEQGQNSFFRYSRDKNSFSDLLAN